MYKILNVLAILLVFSLPIRSQQWNSIAGPNAIAPNKLAFFSANDSILIATNWGVLKGDPNGANWYKPALFPMPAQEVNDLLVDQNGMLGVGYDNNLYSSSDGVAWSSIFTFPISPYSNPLLAREGSFSALSFTISPQTPLLYTSSSLPGSYTLESDFNPTGNISTLQIQNGKIMVGMDGGFGLWIKDHAGNWSNFTVGLINFTNETILSMWKDTPNGKLYIGTSHDLYMADTLTYAFSSVGINNGNPSMKFNDLCIRNGIVFAGTNQGLKKFDPSTLIWSNVDIGLSLANYEIRDLFGKGSQLLIAIDKYGVANFDMDLVSSPSFFLIQANAVTCLGEAGTIPYVGSFPGGTSLDLNLTNTWEIASIPEYRNKTNSVITANGYIFTATNAGVFRYSSSNSWENASGNVALSSNLPSGVDIKDLVFWNGKLLAATNGNGVYKTVDNGNNWGAFPQTPVSSTDNCLDFYLKGSDTLILATATQLYFQTSSNTMMWTAIPQFSTNLGADKVMVVADTLWIIRSGIAYYSPDFGQNWQIAVPQHPNNWYDFASIVESNRNVVILTGAVGIIATANGGETWTDITANIPSSVEVTALGKIGSSLHVGTKWNGLYKMSLSPEIPILSIDQVAIEAECPGTGLGSIKIAVVSGGVPPYSYSLNNGQVQQSNVFTGLAGGSNYTVKVIDGAGNFIEATYFVETGTGFTINTTDYTSDVCDGNLITLAEVSGSPAQTYTFLWEDPNGGNSSFVPGNDLVAGPQLTADFDFYTVTLTDPFGCSNTATVNINRHQGQEVNGTITIGGADIDFAALGIDTVEVRIVKVQSGNDGYYSTVDSFLIVAGQSNAPYKYKFDHIPTGNYKIFARISDSNAPSSVLPTYLGQTIYWGPATLLSFPTSNCNLENQDIDLINSIGQTGIGSISGYIQFGAFKTENIESGDPIPLIDVVVEKDSIFFYTQARPIDLTTYYYQFTNLPLQCYDFIYVNLPGVIQLNEYSPCLTEANPSVIYRDFCADTTGGTTDNTRLDTCSVIPVNIPDFLQSESGVFPNPGTGDFFIQTNREPLQIQVFDLLGQKVAFTWSPVEHKLSLNPVIGIYQVSLEFPDHHENYRVLLRP